MTLPAKVPSNNGPLGQRTRILLRVGTTILLVALFVSTCATYTIEECNFHTVVPGQVYRSAQMNGDDLAKCINQYGIRSILNLRGANPTKTWYKDEIDTASKWHVTHYDWGFGAGDELSIQKMNDLIALLRSTPKPVLIHCQAGADRTGLASALYCYNVERWAPKIADQQLTVWYGHVPLYWLKEQAMDHSFWRYVSNSPAATFLGED